MDREHNFERGDLVRLISGSPILFVRNIRSEGTVDVSWFNEACGKIEYAGVDDFMIALEAKVGAEGILADEVYEKVKAAKLNAVAKSLGDKAQDD